MKKFYLLITVFVLATSLNAQLSSGNYSEYFREGSFLLLEDNYDMALRNFLEAYKLDSSSANINFNVGFCYLNSSTRKGLAEPYLAKAITNISKNYRESDPSEKSAPPLAHFYYGRALHLNYKFDEALAQYDLFDKNYAKDKTNKALVADYKQQAMYAKELVATPINVKIENLGDSINSEYPDFSPVLSADERMIVYTTRRNTSTGGEKDINGQYYEDIVVAHKDENNTWSSPKPISQFINTNGHEASINLTPDGQTLIVFRGISEKDGNLYYSTWDGKDWSFLQQFGSDVNSKYWETHACLSLDNQTLYFVSDRPGGYGGRDIYRCVKLPNGKWSLAQNVGPTINTKYDEDGPFIHPDGVTLIFASNGHKTMGGFDIFFSTIEEDKKFSQPTNMGYPINTPDDDVFFVTSPDGKRGYFSSAKDGGFGEKDIYTMYIPEAKEKPLALFKGSIIAAPGEKLPEDLAIIVTDKETGAVVGTYKPRENGSFSSILPPNKNYNFSYQSKGEEFYNEDLFVSNEVSYQEIKKEINLDPVSLVGKVKVREKRVSLTTLVFNNPKDKTPVPNAKIIFHEIGEAAINMVTDGNGKSENLPLAFDKSYELLAESNGKTSATSSFNTNGIKGSKSITQILYLDGAPEKPFDLLLNVLAVNKKRKPVAGAKVVVTGNDGSRYESLTNEQGKVNHIELLKDVNYDLIVEHDGITSQKVLLTTMNAASKKTYNKTIVLDANGSLANQVNANAGCGTSVSYKYNFSYNKKDLEAKAQDWDDLINALVLKLKECDPEVKILSSASQVPTRLFGGNNKKLAKSRADQLEEDIKAAVVAKGADAGKLVFKKYWAVRGPAYEGDYKNKAKYGKYQYVKVISK